MTLVRESASDPLQDAGPVAIFDDDPRTHGTTICGVPVTGKVSDLGHIVSKEFCGRSFDLHPQCDSIGNEPASSLSAATRIFRCGPCHAGEILDGIVSPKDLRTLRVEDVLQREELRTDPQQVEEVVKGEVVLITGAGGASVPSFPGKSRPRRQRSCCCWTRRKTAFSIFTENSRTFSFTADQAIAVRRLAAKSDRGNHAC